MYVGTEIPTPKGLCAIREHLGLSQMELATALGFNPKNGEHVVRKWESDPEHYRPTPLAWNCLRYLLLTVEVYREGNPESASHAKIGRLLPESLR